MIIKKFRAKDFRNVTACDIEFSPGVNLLHGNNAQGKTNCIEGIYLFSRGKSFRAREDSELVKFGSDGFRLFIEYETEDGTETLEYALYGKERLRKKNGYKISRVSDMIGSFRSVLFYPDDLKLVKGGPEERRNFLNVALSQCYPAYIKYYSDYKKALENRNCLLKFASKGIYTDEREILSWSESMAEYASHIYLLREEYIERLSRHARQIMGDISESTEELSLSYESDIGTGFRDRGAIADEYRRVFRENLSREMAAGVSLYGPHRDDVKISINERDARTFASQGQQRSVVLSMKLAEGEVVRELFGEYPVFLFDDVLSELDEKRRKYVLSGTKDKQVIITSCEPEDFVGFVDLEIDVSGGEYVSSHR
ncbi:MAG: DNA replication/repair protein RecF [Clostridia bacterium]|nr:DNA replication/repair protein RecF [Clostridia bacterium]